MKITYRIACAALMAAAFYGNACAVEKVTGKGEWNDAEACINDACDKLGSGCLDRNYQKAVGDAAMPEENEISDSLLSVVPDNDRLIWNEDYTKLLVVTWKSMEDYESYIEPYTTTSEDEEYVVWVTLAPQVQEFCHDFVKKEGSRWSVGSKKHLDLRLKQYLGLYYTWEYDVFVELWVSPEDLFRPCVDPEITDTVCELDFEEEDPTVKNIADYEEFYKNLYYESFRSSPGVPWTGLGYTYDWGNRKSEVGPSEFILVPSASYEIYQVIPTIEYCTPNRPGQQKSVTQY